MTRRAQRPSYAGIPFGASSRLLAVGLVLTYKTSGVFNLAFGAQAFVSAAVFYDTRSATTGRSSPPSSWRSSSSAPLLGLMLDRLLFRHLRTAPPDRQAGDVARPARRHPGDRQALVRLRLPSSCRRSARRRIWPNPSTTASATTRSTATQLATIVVDRGRGRAA